MVVFLRSNALHNTSSSQQASCHTFVMQQREQEYKDLHHALQIIGLINDDTPKPQMYLLMWLLETGKLRFDWHAQIESDVNHNFLSIANTVLEMLDNDVEAYWLSKGFIHCVSKFQADVPRLTESIMSLLEKEDNELFRTQWISLYQTKFAAASKDLFTGDFGDLHDEMIVAIVALKTFKQHLWYFGEELIGLAMFDEDLNVEIKSRMQKNLLLPAKAKGLKRLNQKLFVTATTLDSYVTEKTANIFDVLLDNGMKMAGESFLLKEPSQWPKDVSCSRRKLHK
uniref:Uncharacterized protein n=1 Tax=Timema cristinae TaxID=61476 RepID=A0A7R9D0U5_TIMCR|nr:unnamed protein product [Timema cristinae]